MNQNREKMIREIAQTIYDKKGMNILALDVREVSSMTDYFIIAEGSVERHVQALAREVETKAKELGLQINSVEGDETGDWAVVDCGEVLIHLFIPELREKYALEELWNEGMVIDLDINIGN